METGKGHKGPKLAPNQTLAQVNPCTENNGGCLGICLYANLNFTCVPDNSKMKRIIKNYNNTLMLAKITRHTITYNKWNSLDTQSMDNFDKIRELDQVYLLISSRSCE